MFTQGLIPAGFMIAAGEDGLTLALCHSDRGSRIVLQSMAAHAIATDDSSFYSFAESSIDSSVDSSVDSSIESATAGGSHSQAGVSHSQHGVHAPTHSSPAHQPAASSLPNPIHAHHGGHALIDASHTDARSTLVKTDRSSVHSPDNHDHGEHVLANDHDHCLSAQGGTAAIDTLAGIQIASASLPVIAASAPRGSMSQPLPLPGRPRAPPSFMTS